MRTNLNLALRLSKEKPKLFGHTFTKGEPVEYYDSRVGENRTGVYITHRSFSTWYNGIEYINNRHVISIIRHDGTESTTDWIRPVTANR